jgi:hypothetical protein
MKSSPLQASYRAIFTELILAQSAAIGTFTQVAGHCALLAGQGCEEVLRTMARNRPAKGGPVAPAHPGGGSETAGASLSRSANLGRALAGMPRVSMLVFLSQYDNLRRQRGAARD